MDAPWVYLANELTGSVHLGAPDADHPWHGLPLCGATVTPSFVAGDETLSGLRATCGVCRRVAGLPKQTRSADL